MSPFQARSDCPLGWGEEGEGRREFFLSFPRGNVAHLALYWETFDAVSVKIRIMIREFTHRHAHAHTHMPTYKCTHREEGTPETAVGVIVSKGQKSFATH